MADLENKIKFTADASQATSEVGVLRKSLKGLGDEATITGGTLGGAMQKGSDGVTKAAGDIDQQTKSISNQFKRLALDAQTAGMSTAQAFKTRIEAKGFSVDSTAALKAQYQTLQQLDARKLADDLAATQASQALTAARKAEKDANTAASLALRNAPSDLNNLGMTAKGTAAALRLVPAQLTDIVVSLQGGQAPLTVLLQQGGQLKDMFGGVGNAAKALGGYIRTLVNPYTVVAAAVLGLGLAFKQGSDETLAFNRALILNGNASGTTTQQLLGMAQAIGQETGSTVGAAAAALATLTTNGNIASANLQQFASVALKVEKETGVSVAETAKQFAALAKDPLSASLALNEGTKYLTLSVYNQIKALMDLGKVQQAGELAQQAHAGESDRRMNKLKDNLGSIESAWRNAGDVAKNTWDFFKGLGRDEDPVTAINDRLQNALKVMQTMQARNAQSKDRGDRIPNYTDKQVAQQQALVSSLQAQKAAMDGVASSQQVVADETAKGVKQAGYQAAFDQTTGQYMQNKVRMQKELNLLAEQFSKVEKTPANIAANNQSRAEIVKRFAPAPDLLNLDLEKFKKEQDKLVGIYGNTQRIIDSLHKAGLLDEANFNEQKKSLIADVEQAAQNDLTQQITRIKQEMALGSTSAEQKLQLQKRLGDAQAALDKAKRDGAANTLLTSMAEQDALNQVEVAFRNANAVAQEYFEGLSRTQGRELAGMGQGNAERARLSGRNQIEDKYAQDARRNELFKSNLEASKGLDGGNAFGVDAQKKYDDENTRIRDFQKMALDDYDRYTKARTDQEQNWQLGASDALKNYLDDTQNVYKSIGDVVGKAFKGMEDAMMDFVQTGKLDFASLANSIINDLIRIQIQKNVTGALGKSIDAAGGIGGLLSAGASLLGFANGGQPPVGVPSMVGERGPELFVPQMAGTIIPNHELNSKNNSSSNVVVNIIESPGKGGQQSRTNQNGVDTLTVMVERIKNSIAGDINQGSGSVPAALNRTYGLNRSVGSY